MMDVVFKIFSLFEAVAFATLDTMSRLIGWLTLFKPAFLSLLDTRGGGHIYPKPIKMVFMGGRFQKRVGTLYLTKIDARHKVLQLLDTWNHPN